MKAAIPELGPPGMVALFLLDLPQEASLNREKVWPGAPRHRR